MVAVLAIVPIVLLVMLGYLIGRRRWLSDEAATGLAKLTFTLFMPVLLFTGIAQAALAEGLSPHLLLGYFLPVLLVFTLVNLLVHLRRGKASPLGLSAAYSNNVLIGIPLVATLLGTDSLIYLFAILVFHSLLLFSLHSLYAAFGSGEKLQPLALLKTLGNPIIIGLLLGAALNVSGLALPAPLWTLAGWLSAAAMPCALMVLGMSLARYSLRVTPAVLGLTLAKLAVFPLAVYLLGTWLGLNDTARAVLVLMAACPTGVNVLAFVRTAQDSATVSSTVCLSTLLATVSLPLWMALLG